MKKVLLALIFATISVHASTKVELKNNKVTVQENGIRKDYGSVRRVENVAGGGIKIYTNKNFSGAAVTIDRFGNTKTQQYNNSVVTSCKYNCALETDEEYDEENDE